MIEVRNSNKFLISSATVQRLIGKKNIWFVLVFLLVVYVFTGLTAGSEPSSEPSYVQKQEKPVPLSSVAGISGKPDDKGMTEHPNSIKPDKLQFYEVPEIVDGDSLVMAGRELRLLCYDAVELHQSCRDASGAEYACGEMAKNALAKLIGQEKVFCAGRMTDIYNRPLVNCWVGDVSVADVMVKLGWAVGICKNTRQLARLAKNEKVGIWAGSFETPKVWRKQHPYKRKNHGDSNHSEFNDESEFEDLGSGNTGVEAGAGAGNEGKVTE